MQQLGGTQVHHQRQHETPQMPELILRRFVFNGRKKHRRNEGRPGIITDRPSVARVAVSQQEPLSLGRPFFMRQRRKWR
jgi:hypothetical protein